MLFRYLRKITISTVNLVALLLLVSCSAEQTPSEQDQKTSPKRVWAMSLTDTNKKPERHLTGQLQAADTVPISFEVNGVIKLMNVNLGESFKQGELLAQLDKTVYELSVQRQQSAFGEAQATVAEAKLGYERNKVLKQQGLVSQAVLDNAKTNFDVAIKRADVAQSALKIARKNLTDTDLFAPYSGRVSARLVEPSQQVNPGIPVFEIQGEAKLEVSAAIPETLISKVSLFDQVKVKVPSISGDRMYGAVLTEIGAQASIANAFPVTVTLNETNPNFFPGMSAELVINIDGVAPNSNHFVIPVGAYATDAKGDYVYQISAANKVNKVYIDIIETYQKEVLISPKNAETMLKVNTQIIRTGLSYLRPDQEVIAVGSSISIYND